MNAKIAIESIQDFIGSQDVIQAFECFFQSPSQPCMMIIGQSGCGKSTLCKLMIEKYNMCSFRPIFEDYTTHKDLVETIEKFTKTRTMLEIFENRQKVLFLDDIETLITLDRYANTYINNLITNVKKTKQCKILITCSAGQEKKVTELKKKMLWHKMQNPQLPELVNLVKKHVDSSVDAAKITKYVKAMHYNVRSVLTNLHMLTESCDSNLLREEMTRTTHDKNITEVVSSIIATDEKRLKYLDIWLSTEPCLICYISYDNKHNCNPRDPLSSITPVVDAYANTTIMETVSYNKNDWFLSDICNLYRFATFKVNCKNKFQPEYTTILTKTSQYFTLLKKQKELCSKLSISPRHSYLISTDGAVKQDLTEYISNFNKLKDSVLPSNSNVSIQRPKRTK